MVTHNKMGNKKGITLEILGVILMAIYGQFTEPLPEASLLLEYCSTWPKSLRKTLNKKAE